MIATQDRAYFKKLVWAKAHLDQLETAISEYSATKPYTVAKAVEGKREVWRVHITDPPDEISLMLGDFLFNLRASLEYLAGDLVAPKERYSAFFPIFAERIWDIPFAEGETEERTKLREKWSFLERTMHPEALKVIRDTHPPDGTPKAGEPMHTLRMLSALANKDRHRKLNVVASGLDREGFTGTFVYANAMRLPMAIEAKYGGYRNHAIIESAPNVVDIEIDATVVVLIEHNPEWGNVHVPPALEQILQSVTSVASKLEPYFVK